MSTKERERVELLQGTLDLLILRTLQLGPAHGHAIAKAIEFKSDDVLQVEQGSLYPALHRLVERNSTGLRPRAGGNFGWRPASGTNSRRRLAGFFVQQSGRVSHEPPQAYV